MRESNKIGLAMGLVIITLAGACRSAIGIDDLAPGAPPDVDADGGADHAAGPEGGEDAYDASVDAHDASADVYDSGSADDAAEAGIPDALDDREAESPDANDAADVAVKNPCAVTRGSSMVQITAAPGLSYCIDTREATLTEFRAFAADIAATTFYDGRPACTGQHPSVPQSGADDAAVTPISYCDTYAYCRWSGKRLCGKIGGGRWKNGTDTDAQNEWLRACGNGVGLKYPYGATYGATTCTTEATASTVAGARPACHGTTAPYDAIFDMSGNASEWDDTDDNDVGVARYRGGDYDSLSDTMCSTSYIISPQTNSSGAHTGARCCMDPK